MNYDIGDWLCDQLPLCGCAEDDMAAMVRRELEEASMGTATGYAGMKPERRFVLQILDHCGWLDHGTSMRGGYWITDSGRAALRLLSEDERATT